MREPAEAPVEPWSRPRHEPRNLARTPCPSCCAATPASTATRWRCARRSSASGAAITWGEYEARTRAFALGLRELGIGAGDVVGLIGDNRPDWVMGEIAAHALGARSLGIYRDALEDEVAYLLEFCGAMAVLAEDEEQVDKLLNISDRVPTLRHIVYSDPRGMRKYADPRLLPAAELVEARRGGARRGARRLGPARGRDARRGRGDPLHHLRHHGAAEARHADRPRADPALRELPQGRPAGAGGRLRLRAAAALDHGADLRPRLGADRPDAGELRRGARDHDGRLPRDRPELRALRAARVGVARGRCARPRHGRLAAQARHVRRSACGWASAR